MSSRSFYGSTAIAAGSRGVAWPSGLIAFWDFSETSAPFVAKVGAAARTELVNGTGSNVTKSGSGPFGTPAVFNGTSDHLTVPVPQIGGLQVAAGGDEVTVVAWIRRSNTGTGFIGGLWSEAGAAPRRNYALFSSLPAYGGTNQVCGHVSTLGGATPGYPFSIDYSASARKMATGTWYCAAFTYDGTQAISYLDGMADPRPTFTDNQAATYAKNPYVFTSGLNRGATQAPFTVGGNLLGSGALGNLFNGSIGGLAVFNRALSQAEIAKLSATVATLSAHPVTHFAFIDGNNTFADLIGCKQYRTSAGTDVTTNGSVNGFVLVNVSGQEYLARSAQNPGETASIPSLFTYENFASIRASQVGRVTFDLNNSLAADTVRLAFKIGTTWYASATTFSVTGDGRVGSSWATAEAKTFTFDRAANSLAALTVNPGTSLALGATIATAVPNGPLNAIGVYNGGLTGAIRLRNLTLWAV